MANGSYRPSWIFIACGLNIYGYCQLKIVNQQQIVLTLRFFALDAKFCSQHPSWSFDPMIA